MLLVGEDPKKFINDYSNQFKKDFLQLLRTSHGEKQVHINHFYPEYIHNKEHIHMNCESARRTLRYLCNLAVREKGKANELDSTHTDSFISSEPDPPPLEANQCEIGYEMAILNRVRQVPGPRGNM